MADAKISDSVEGGVADAKILANFDRHGMIIIANYNNQSVICLLIYSYSQIPEERRSLVPKGKNPGRLIKKYILQG